MAELTNPYANPYLPSFVSQRPVVGNPAPANNLPTPQMNYSGIQFGQIHPVKGFEGADAYAVNLANGASEILAEEDPNLARIYVTAKDNNGKTFVQGFDLTPVPRPKAVTMDDLNSKMNQLLDRMSKLEEEKANGDQSVSNASWRNAGKPANSGIQSAGRNSQNVSESGGGNKPDHTK